jgi:hypothetical protein
VTTVAAEHVDLATSAALRAVWATLPTTLRPTEGPAELQAVGAGSADWPSRVRAAAGRGARVIVLLAPTPVDGGEVRRLAGHLAVPVVAQTTWVPSPVVTQFRRRWAEDLGHSAVVRVSTHDSLDRSAESALLDQLVLVRAALGPVTRILFARFGEHGHTVLADAGGRTVHLSGVRTAVAVGRARLSALGGDREHRLELPAPGTASPARAAAAGPEGEHVLPAVHEDRARATWRTACLRLANRVTDDELGDLADDLDRVAQAVELSSRF